MSEVFPDNLLLVGKVSRPHGLGGILRIWSYARSEETFLESGRVFLKPSSGETHEYRVLSVVRHKNVYLMKLKGLDSIEAAEEYRGAAIFISKEALRREGEEEYFWHEIIGLEVYLEPGRFIGTIRHILPTGGHDIYVVQGDRGEVLIPATHEVVKDIDRVNKKMIVSEIEGLFDLNEA
ncbi:MAG: ribosome maturation factor RimM [Proteobacteria bacterium]|nr:ribosome maturation factor RimM [Pseudomonadota bacterium]